MFSFGHCLNEGGGGPCPNLKIHFIYSLMMAEKDVQVARKKTFIFKGGLPLLWTTRKFFPGVEKCQTKYKIQYKKFRLESCQNDWNVSRLPGLFPAWIGSYKTAWEAFKLFWMFLGGIWLTVPCFKQSLSEKYLKFPKTFQVHRKFPSSNVTFWTWHSWTFRRSCDCWCNNDDSQNHQKCT